MADKSTSYQREMLHVLRSIDERLKYIEDNLFPPASKPLGPEFELGQTHSDDGKDEVVF